MLPETDRLRARREYSTSCSAATARVSTQTRLHAADRCRQKYKSDDRRLLDEPTPPQPSSRRRQTNRKRRGRLHRDAREYAPPVLQSLLQATSRRDSHKPRTRNFAARVHRAACARLPDETGRRKSRATHLPSRSAHRQSAPSPGIRAALQSRDRRDSSTHPSLPANRETAGSSRRAPSTAHNQIRDSARRPRRRRAHAQTPESRNRFRASGSRRLRAVRAAAWARSRRKPKKARRKRSILLDSARVLFRLEY